jgi:hypothetical protein
LYGPASADKFSGLIGAFGRCRQNILYGKHALCTPQIPQATPNATTPQNI